MFVGTRGFPRQPDTQSIHFTKTESCGYRRPFVNIHFTDWYWGPIDINSILQLNEISNCLFTIFYQKFWCSNVAIAYVTVRLSWFMFTRRDTKCVAFCRRRESRDDRHATRTYRSLYSPIFIYRSLSSLSAHVRSPIMISFHFTSRIERWYCSVQSHLCISVKDSQLIVILFLLPTASEGGHCFSGACLYLSMVCPFLWRTLQPKRLNSFWLWVVVEFYELVGIE